MHEVAVGVNKGSEMVLLLVEAVAGGDPHVDEECPLCGLHVMSPPSLK